MELHVVSYGIDSVARPLLLFFSSENWLLWFRNGYAVSSLMDTTYWSSEYDVLVSTQKSKLQISSFKASKLHGRLRCKGVTKQIVGVIPKGLALRVVLVDLHSKDESGKGFKLEVN
ncbi:hypothetical protein Tco_0694873 [Tanacetum coccineum]